MKTKNALPFILALGMTAGSTAVYAQTASTDLNADVTATTDVGSTATDAATSTATSTDVTTQACAEGDNCASTSADASSTMAPAADVDADADASATADAGTDPMTSVDTDTSASADAGAAPMTPMGSEATTEMAADADADADIRANLTDIASVADTSELVGARAYDANDEWIGEISAVIPAEGEITEEQFVIDVGGFLGIGEKPVALTASSLQVQLDEDGGVDHVVVDHTMADLEQMPEVEM